MSSDIKILTAPGINPSDEAIAKLMHGMESRAVGVYRGTMVLDGNQVYWTYSHMGSLAQSEIIFETSQRAATMHFKRLQSEALKKHVLN